jgi:predicted enzyme related to lactoylglutathione lyase
MANNDIVWADIPVSDMDRASKFYAQVLGKSVVGFPGMEGIALIGMTPPAGEAPMPRSDEPIVSADFYLGGTPSTTGATVYFNADGDINGMVARVREAGGEVLEEPQFRGDMIGWVAFFRDTEGNRIGIQQPAENK